MRAANVTINNQKPTVGSNKLSTIWRVPIVTCIHPRVKLLTIGPATSAIEYEQPEWPRKIVILRRRRLVRF